MAEQTSNFGLTSRRGFVLMSVFGFLGATGLATLRFFFPRVLFEPKTRFKIGQPSDFGLGVDTKYQSKQRIWVVRESSRLYVILAKCTHLGCTPDWKGSEKKFKCPCHGSGFDMEGVNFEGPAPKPLGRLKVQLAADGQIIVDKGKVYDFEQWEDPSSYIHV